MAGAVRGFASPEIVTAGFVYARLHGPLDKPYVGSYNQVTLSAYARKFRQWALKGIPVYCYFDNDQKACAPHDAQRLTAILQE